MEIVENPDFELAHRHSIRHRAKVETSKICGCFYCQSTFSPTKIVDWMDGGQTALCPRCSVDAVLGSASGLPITREFLERMHERWLRP